MCADAGGGGAGMCGPGLGAALAETLIASKPVFTGM